jgi:hypothetical protein
VDQLDEPLRALVARGMAKDPAHRPASATDIVTHLEATATEAYGGDWESRGRGKLAEYAAAYATAWHQPGTATGVLQAAVIPHQYRLDNGHWVDMGPRNDASAVGRSGWLAILEEPPTIISYRPQGPGHLVATLGARQIDIASNVTAFAWDTPRS